MYVYLNLGLHLNFLNRSNKNIVLFSSFLLSAGLDSHLDLPFYF